MVPSSAELHRLPVSEIRMAKKTGSRKKRSRDLVTDRSAMPETYPKTEYSAARAAVRATYREVVEVCL